MNTSTSTHIDESILQVCIPQKTTFLANFNTDLMSTFENFFVFSCISKSTVFFIYLVICNNIYARVQN